MERLRPYEKPVCRVSGVEFETALLTGSSETYPIDPFDPELD